MIDICYDTEFLDDGSTIGLISIGLVADRREYYAVNADCNFKAVCEHDWLWGNVCPHLPTTKRDWTNPNHGRSVTRLDLKSAIVKPKWVIANEVREFILDGFDGASPDLWAYYSAYDHVALAQLWGPMSELPEGIPMWTHDLMQLWERFETVKKPVRCGDAHNALDDARWNMQLLRRLREEERAAALA